MENRHDQWARDIRVRIAHAQALRENVDSGEKCPLVAGLQRRKITAVLSALGPHPDQHFLAAAEYMPRWQTLLVLSGLLPDAVQGCQTLPSDRTTFRSGNADKVPGSPTLK